MNITEGLRRLALVLGVAGFGVGCFIAYRNLLPLLHERGEGREFHALASLERVQRELAKIRAGKKYGFKNGETGERGIFYWTGEQPPTDEDTSRVLVNGYAVRAGQVQAIGLNSKGELLFLQRGNGDKLFDTAAPTVPEYLLLGVFPVLGFLTPWVVLRTVLWIGAGFSHARPSNQVR